MRIYKKNLFNKIKISKKKNQKIKKKLVSLLMQIHELNFQKKKICNQKMNKASYIKL